jgi:5'-3' exonuclease
MNGIIHNCTHPSDRDQFTEPLTEKEMVINIFNYLDRIVNTIKPRKLLYMAVDGIFHTNLTLVVFCPNSH